MQWQPQPQSIDRKPEILSPKLKALNPKHLSFSINTSGGWCPGVHVQRLLGKGLGCRVGVSDWDLRLSFRATDFRLVAFSSGYRVRGLGFGACGCRPFHRIEKYQAAATEVTTESKIRLRFQPGFGGSCLRCGVSGLALGSLGTLV